MLTNQWDGCGPGEPGYKYITWYQSGYTQPNPTQLNRSYRDWVREVATRYHNEPTIMMWQLVNEMETKNLDDSCDQAAAAQAMISFVRDVSGVIKAADPNHLVNASMIGTGQCGTVDTYYRQIDAVATVDLCEYHDYSRTSLPLGIQQDIDQCAAIDKPIFDGETATKPGDLDGTLQARADLFSNKLSTQFAAGIAGFVAFDWSLTAAWAPDNYHINPQDPALAVLRRSRYS